MYKTVAVIAGMCIQLVRTLLEDLPRMFADNKNAQCALGPALQAATKLLVGEVDVQGADHCFIQTVYYIGFK